jgi:hypothetical protein
MLRLVVGLGLALSLPSAAWAQEIIESAGSRALGMAGAFVAVADDATAVYWNPAGLATGPPAGMTIGWADFRSGDPNQPPAPGPTHRTSRFVSLGTMPLGLSYGRFQESTLVTRPGLGPLAESLDIFQAGVTLVQSVAQGVVVGSTIKYMHGGLRTGPVTGTTTGDALDQAGKLDGPSSGHFDFDIGTMLDFGKARLGLLVRNLLEPTFDDGAGSAITFRRHARAGLAVMPTAGLTLAMDLDLDTVDLRDGPRRELAFGGENRFGNRWALRAGVRWSLTGPSRRVAATGASLAIRQNLWLDGHYTRGNIDADRGFGGALRVGF